MVNYGNRKDQEYISTVNITPFTDVVLVILIVFMISAPGIFSSHLDILLPGTSRTRTEKKPERIIGLDAGGVVYFNEKSVNDEELTTMIRELVKQNPDEKVLLNADRRVTHGRVVEILDILRKEGVHGTYVGAVRQ